MIWSILQSKLGDYMMKHYARNELPGDTLRDSIRSAEKLKARLTPEKEKEFKEKFEKKAKEAGTSYYTPTHSLGVVDDGSDLVNKLKKRLKDGNT